MAQIDSFGQLQLSEGPPQPTPIVDHTSSNALVGGGDFVLENTITTPLTSKPSQKLEHLDNVPRSIHTLLDRGASEALVVDGDFPLDQNVIAELPRGSKVLSANRSGTSAWTVTARLNVGLADGTKTRYFLKCAAGEKGRIMMEGEFNGMSEIYKTMPGFVPKPHAWGSYGTGSPETHFFLQQYIDMSDRVPDPNQLCSKLAALHEKSVSPTGKFGFHITTCQGQIPQKTGGWEDKWTNLFTKMLRHVVDLDIETNGFWKELDILEKRIFSHVIPKLIGNLERDGRSIKPSLIHGDLWEGNTGTCYETGNIYIYDSGTCYAHNEFEIGDWRCHYNKIHNKVYTRTYLKHYGPSEPKDEWDDRNRMYCIYFNTIYSVNHLDQGTAVRQTAYDDMYYLIDKYAPFAEGEGPPRLTEADRTGLSKERDHTAA
ncbi:Fructosamine-3-kinase [Lachnellula cervina]|uniref:protein-ribulosamine 3-kinase n=1 Tax=Lachnellula cervina TaxID=1316786 RepID=A0A7D8UUJ7_9HELO|nr:Fructosamine-3-kinase [Lachnellula cervina]